VLLDEQMQRAMDLVITHRGECGLPPENKFVFGLKGDAEGYIPYARQLRRLSNEIGVKDVSTSQMRKYLATVYQARHLKAF